MKVQLFIPCFIDQMSSEVGVASYELLQKLGCEVDYPQSQTCCGQAAYNAGFKQEAKVVFQRCTKQFKRKYPLVSPSASCASFVREQQTDSQIWGQLECHEITYFIKHILKKLLDNNDFNDFPYDVAFHSSCSSLRESPKVAQDAISLLEKIPGLNLIQHFVSQDECCGFGGSFSLKFPSIADAMAKRKLTNIQQTHPITYITSTDMSCLLHLKKTIQKNNLPLEVMHITQLLNMSLKS